MDNTDIFKGARKEYARVLQNIATKLSITANSNAALPYSIEVATLNRIKDTGPWFVSGISGSGKSTVTSNLAAHGYEKLRNITTRAKRPGETDADYIFTDDATFKMWEAQGRIFDPHITNKVWHGILFEDLQKLQQGGTVFMDKSVKSVRGIVHAFPDMTQSVNFVYILPPSFDVLLERLLGREVAHAHAGMQHHELLDRFAEEIDEMAQTVELPYAYIVNDNAERVQQLLARQHHTDNL